MAVKGVLLPKITVEGMPGFLLWARQAQPDLFNALARQFPEVANFAEAVGADDRPGDLRGFFDILSTIGTDIGKVAGSIGNFVVNNGGAILGAGAGYLVAQQQAKVVQAQLALAQANRAPAQTALVTTAGGQQIAVPVQPSGTGYATGYSTYGPPPSAGGIMATLAAVPLSTWLLGAGALAGVALLLKRR